MDAALPAFGIDGLKAAMGGYLLRGEALIGQPIFPLLAATKCFIRIPDQIDQGSATLHQEFLLRRVIPSEYPA